MVDSLTLTLFHATRAFQQRVSAALLSALNKRGDEEISAAQLTFLAELDCGTNHASELARRAGVSRQAVHKMVRELAALGVLTVTTDDDRRNQKVIMFTEKGEKLMADCRRLIADMDSGLTNHLDEAEVKRLISTLETDLGG